MGKGRRRIAAGDRGMAAIPPALPGTSRPLYPLAAMLESMMPSQNFRFPGVLNSQELLVAEAVLARAWAVLDYDARTDPELEAKARDRLGGIILRAMSRGSDSISDLAAAAVAEFRATRPMPRIEIAGRQDD